LGKANGEKSRENVNNKTKSKKFEIKNSKKNGYS